MKTKRLLAIILAFAMVMGIMPAFSVMVSAASELTDTTTNVTIKDTDEDGYYEISTVDELYAFANIVNAGNSSVNAKLMNDITVNKNLMSKITINEEDGSATINDGETVLPWTPIGIFDNSLAYRGNFDGCGFEISGLYCVSSLRDVGFFGYVEKNTICNLGVVDSYFRNTNTDVREDWLATGSIVGENWDCIAIDRCYSNSIVVSDRGTIGGIVGQHQMGPVNNCRFSGKIIVTHRYFAGGIVGWLGRSTANSYITNCYNIGTGMQYNICGIYKNGSISNCYGLDTSSTFTETGVTIKDTQAFASGEVAYLLGEAWGQDLSDANSLPTLGGKKVYCGYETCNSEMIYSNTELPEVPLGHTDENKDHICDVCTIRYSCFDEDNNHICDVCEKVLSECGDADGDHICDVCEKVLSECDYNNGFGECGCYQYATDSDEDGYYEIGNVGQLFWFAKKVNSGKSNINGKLTADIDLENRAWTIICETGLYYNGYGTDYGYSGTFDGNNHIIKNIRVTSSDTRDASCGLFGTVSGTIKNLGIEGFAFEDGGYDIRAGAIVGQLITANGKVSNCYVKGATIDPKEHVAGGIAGCVYEGTIENCYVVESTISGTSGRFGHIVGDSRGDKSESDRKGTVTNCYCDNASIRSNNVGNVTNCETKSKEAFASGEVAYLLNGSKSDANLAWYQTIGTDSLPKYAGGTVYEILCVDVEYYSNENKNYETHDFKGGICTRCGSIDLTADENGIYQIYTAEDLMLFARFVNDGNTTANAKLMADIDLEDYDWIPIGTYSDTDGSANAAYSGTFDGNYHVIKNLDVKVETANETGLFGRISGGTVKNLGVVNATVENTKDVRAGVIAGEIHNSTVTKVFTAGEITVNTTSAQAGGIAGECADSVLTDCYTTYGYLTSNAGTLNNCYYMADEANTKSKGTNLSKSSFTSGELTYKLNRRSTEGIWKQTLNTDEYPGFTGETVYAVSETCDESNITSYSNNADVVIPHSFGKDGICKVCSAFEPAKYVNGVYEISNVGQYMWFAKLVNDGSADANAKLMADIDMTDYQSTYGNVMIGTSTAKYSGNFDGNGKKLTVGFNATEEYAAPFRYIDGATIQNLTVDGTIATSAKFAAGVVGSGEGDSRIEKCMVGVTINSSVNGDGTHGGLVAVVNSGSMTIDNCGFIGSITGNATNSCGGFVGWANGTTEISNSFVSGTFTTGTSGCNTFGRNPGNIKISNSYYKMTYGSDNEGATQKSAEQFASGEVAHLLGEAWGQDLSDANSLPTLGGKKVLFDGESYYNEKVNVTVDGTEKETDGSIVLGTENGDGTYSLPENVVGYYFDDDFVDAGKYAVVGGEVITTVNFNVTMVNGAQVRFGGGLDENGKISTGNGLRFLAMVDRSNFDAEGYGMKITAEGSSAEEIVIAEKWQNDDVTFTVAITDMAESNYIRKFTATPFVKVKYDNGSEKTIYGTETVTRSVYQVAAGLLKDETQTAYGLSDVLNAYANQTGIRLVVKSGELKANTSYTTNGAYCLTEDELHFVVSDAEYDKAGNKYSVILTPQGNAEIITDNDFWYDYIRINNNNSLVKDKVTVEKVEGSDKAVKVTFAADGLIERPADTNDNTTPDDNDDNFDGETEGFN